MNIHILSLLSPLHYISVLESNPFYYRSREKIYCFELDENEQKCFEPEKSRLIGRLVFCGEAPGEEQNDTANTLLELPKANYLFAQKQGVLNMDEISEIAVEIQKEGLWQRLNLGKLLYLRYLYEDGSDVTQLFRPYT